MSYLIIDSKEREYIRNSKTGRQKCILYLEYKLFNY